MTPVPEAATTADLPRLGEILSDWIDETGWLPRLHSREEDAGFVAGLAKTHVLRVVRDGGMAQGFLARRGEEIDALYLSGMSRGRGIGTALVAEAQHAGDRLSLWTFHANEGARRFYARLGFIETDRTGGEGNEARLPDVRLEWRRTG